MIEVKKVKIVHVKFPTCEALMIGLIFLLDSWLRFPEAVSKIIMPHYGPPTGKEKLPE